MQMELKQGRLRLVLPREHGAWAMLLLPYVTGVLVTDWNSGSLVRIILGLAGILLLFMARYPVITLARRRYRRGSFGDGMNAYWFSAIVYSAAAIAPFAVIVMAYGRLQLVQLAVLALVIAMIQSSLAVTRGERSMAAELTGVVLLTLTSNLGVLLAGGDAWSRPSLTLWAANATYFAASVFNVKMKVASMVARREHFPWRERLRIGRGSIAYLAAAILVWTVASFAGTAPRWAFSAFLPLAGYLLWSLATMSSRLKIKAEGFIQLALAVAFAALVVIAWRIG